jgi:hypothetical protein
VRHQGLLIDVTAGASKQDGRLLEAGLDRVLADVWNSETGKITCFGPGKFRPGCDLEALKNGCLELYLYKLSFSETSKQEATSASEVPFYTVIELP